MLTSKYFQVNYEAPVSDIFRNMMLGYVKHYHSLELMSDAMEHDGESIPGLPSWAPDWSLPTASRHMSLGAAASYSGYNACGGQGTLVCGDLYDVDPDVLRIAGKIHDEVEWVSEALDSLDYSPLPWKRRPGVMERIWDHVRGRLGSERETYHAFWRTLLANADKDGFPATDDLYPEFLRFWHDSKVHDRSARLYRAQHSGDDPLSPEQERALFRDHSEDPEGYGKTMTEEDYAASKAHLDFQLSQTFPCTSAPDCRHCTALASLLPELLKDGISVGGPSPALPFREKDPFIADFFRALGKDSRLMTCDFHLNILSRMRPVLQNRTFIITKGGLMGLGPKFTRPGDDIAILSGARVPFILRKTGTSKILPEIGVGFRLIQDYRVVGDCYVHGIMDGEAVRDLDWRDGGYEVLDLV